MPGWDGEPGGRRRRPPPHQPRTTRVAQDSSFPGAPQPGPGMPPALAPGPGCPGPRPRPSRCRAPGKLCRQAGRDQRVAGNRLDQLSRQGGLAPCDPALPIDLDELRVRTRPDKDQAFLARLEQTPSSGLGQGSQGLALFPAHDVGPHPAVGAGVGRRSQSRHEMDRPRPDLWKCTSHHGIGQLGKARGRKHVRHRQQAFLGREHPGGDDQIRARRCSRSLRRPISKSSRLRDHFADRVGQSLA